MTEPMKTAEEILRAKFSGLSHKIVTPVHPVQKTLIVAAMQEYADQEKSAERERIKDTLNKVQGSWSYQQVIELIDSM